MQYNALMTSDIVKFTFNINQVPTRLNLDNKFELLFRFRNFT